ncbi:MAG TPA: TonB-dependent receptor [Bryobacteraceae bacterium]|nr:TonB-dependent receptor [Bryobacteraceae bacterium]
MTLAPRLLPYLLLLLPLAGRAADLLVTDGSGLPVPSAVVVVRNAQQSRVAEAVTDERGEAPLPLPPGAYAVEIRATGFAATERRVRLGSGRVAVALAPGELRSQITVTASRGTVEDTRESARIASVISRDALAERPLPTTGAALESSPGILVQQTAYGQVSPFLRGLTGYHVVNLLDGVRFNNATFRSGPNQYLAFVDPAQIDRIEAVLGPAGSLYGSDSLGGAIHVLSASPSPGSGRVVHGDVALSGSSADLSGGAVARLSAAGRGVAWLGGISARRHNDLRAGGSNDSHNVLQRLFGLSSAETRNLLGARLQDTGFGQHGVHSKLLLSLPRRQNVTLWYQGSRTEDVRGYKDLLGGLGRLASAFDPQRLHFFYGRYEKLRAGPLDSLTGTFSVNSQRDGSVRQGLRLSDAVIRDDIGVDVFGYAAQAATHIGRRNAMVFGSEIYDERVDAVRLSRSNGQTEAQRALYPDGSRYTTYGLYAQDTWELGRLRISGGGRFTSVAARTFAASNPGLGVADSSQTFRDLTFDTSVAWQAATAIGLFGNVSRGFRAPNLNDLGALGLNDLGYEIPVSEAIPAGALLGTSSGEGALSAGRSAAALGPERLFNYEAGIKVRGRRTYARVQLFDAEMLSPIVRRTLLFSEGAVPGSLAGLPVTALPQSAAQRAQGVLTVATALDPRAVKAFVNDGRARYYGLEALAEWSVSSRWRVEANYSFLAGRELNPNRYIRRLPPQQGYAAVRYMPSGRRPWIEASMSVAGAQERLSGGDLDDERIGASRSRRDIADFFNGAVAARWIANGIFTPTGETLAAIQKRVLPAIAGDAVRVPLYTSTPAWYALGLRGGVPLDERLNLSWAVANLLDRNYRVHGSGIDAPGLNAWVAVRYCF